MKKVSRSSAVQEILNSGGRMFTVSWVSVAGKQRKINGKFTKPCTKRRNQDKIFGYLTIYDHRNHSYKRVNTRTINELHINGNKLKVR